MQEYEYKPLPDGESIRILTLESGQQDEPLKGILDFVNVNSTGSYEPISYVWGPPNFVHEISIVVGGVERPIKLTSSLYEALKRLRLCHSKRRVWADQICINQHNLKERSQQMQFMNAIYKNASHVLVWLGLDEKLVAKSAFNFVHELDGTFEDVEKSKIFHISHTTNLKEQSRSAWNVLDDLTQLKWFTRGWMVQEIGTKAPATLFWGDAEIDWMVLSRVCEKLTDYHHLRSTFKIRTSDIKYFFQRFAEPDMESHHANRVNFIYELHRARGLQFTDSRDRVFAWLGHYSLQMSSKELGALQADYDKTVAEVYMETAKRALEGDVGKNDGSALITLAAVQHISLQSHNESPAQKSHGVQDTRRDTLPSWVPDWRTYQSFILSEPISPHRAHGTSSPKLKFIGGGLILQIYGLEIDSIEVCSRPFATKEFHGKAQTGVSESPIGYIWHEICQKDRFNLGDKYINGQESLFACMQTLGNGCVQIAGREKRSYHEIPRSRWLEQEAVYLVNTLGQSDSVAPDVRQLAGEADLHTPEQWSRSASAASKNRAFAKTSKGYYILGPRIMDAGDVVCVLFGGKLPFCLRPWGTRYLLVGECYVHGLMDGEAMEMMGRNELIEKPFDIV